LGPTFHLLRRPLAFAAAFSFFVNLLLLVPALFMLQVFDRVITSQSRETLLVLLIGVAVALALMFALDYLRSRLQGVAGNLLADSLLPTVALETLARSARQPETAAHDGLRDVASLRNLFSSQGLLAVFDAPWALVYIAVIWLAHPVLGVTAVVSALLMLALALLNARITRQGIEDVQRAASKAQRYLESSMHNAEVVQSLGMGPALMARWRRLSAELAVRQGPTARRSVAMAALTRTTRQAVQVAMQAMGAYLVITGDGSPGVMVAATILLGRALAPVEQIVGSWRVLAEGRLALRRLAGLLDAAARQPERMALPAPAGQLVAHNLVYRAPRGDRLILAGVSLSLAPGESLAIVGPSGAGKSTLVRLLTGVRPPSAGEVRLDHVDLAQWPREQVGAHIGYLPQDVELFSGTVAENIARLGDVDSPKVVAAAQRAGAHELILSFPEGYDTPIEPSGSIFSPGQRQRIALARALYGEPKLLVLDEPNANLDGASELALGEVLRGLQGKVTTIVVSHRIPLVQHMTKMLALEGGRVTHYGPLPEVMQALQGGAARAGGAQVVAMPRGTAQQPGTRPEGQGA